MSGVPFDPTQYVRAIRSGDQTVEFLDVKWRLVWLRRVHSDAQLATEHVQLDRDGAVFRATISIPGQGSATGYGSATSTETTAFVERAETRAIGRALQALGFGTQYGADFLLEPAVETPPPPSPTRPPVRLTEGLPSGVTIGPTGATSLPPRLAQVFADAQPIVDETPAEPLPTPPPPVLPPLPTVTRPPAASPDAAERTSWLPGPGDGGRSSAGRPAPPPVSPGPRRLDEESRPATGRSGQRERGEEEERPFDTIRPARSVLSRVPAATFDEPEDGLSEAEELDDPLVDSDWTAFWRWARRRGFNNRDEIEQALGQTIRGRTPKELRTLILNLDA